MYVLYLDPLPRKCIWTIACGAVNHDKGTRKFTFQCFHIPGNAIRLGMKHIITLTLFV